MRWNFSLRIYRVEKSDDNETWMGKDVEGNYVIFRMEVTKIFWRLYMNYKEIKNTFLMRQIVVRGLIYGAFIVYMVCINNC
jgi:hypothetical protein